MFVPLKCGWQSLRLPSKRFIGLSFIYWQVYFSSAVLFCNEIVLVKAWHNYVNYTVVEGNYSGSRDAAIK